MFLKKKIVLKPFTSYRIKVNLATGILDQKTEFCVKLCTVEFSLFHVIDFICA